MLIFLTNHRNSPSIKQPVDVNLISADGYFSFQLFLAQKYMYYCNPLRPRWRFLGVWIIASSTPCPPSKNPSDAHRPMSWIFSGGL